MKNYLLTAVLLLAFCVVPLAAQEKFESSKYYETVTNTVLINLEQEVQLPANQTSFPNPKNTSVTYSDLFKKVLNSYKVFLDRLENYQYDNSDIWRIIKRMDSAIYGLGKGEWDFSKDQAYYAYMIGNNLYYSQAKGKLVDMTFFTKGHKKELKNVNRAKNPLLYVLAKLEKNGHGTDVDYKAQNNIVSDALYKDMAESKNIIVQYLGGNGIMMETTLYNRYKQLFDAYNDFLALMASNNYDRKNILRKIGQMDRLITYLQSEENIYKEDGKINGDGSIAAKVAQRQKFYAEYIAKNVYFLNSKSKLINMAYLYRSYKDYLRNQSETETPLMYMVAQQGLKGEIIDLPVKNKKAFELAN